MRWLTEAVCPHYGTLFFFEATLKSAVAIPAAPQVAPGEPASIV